MRVRGCLASPGSSFTRIMEIGDFCRGEPRLLFRRGFWRVLWRRRRFGLSLCFAFSFSSLISTQIVGGTLLSIGHLTGVAIFSPPGLLFGLSLTGGDGSWAWVLRCRGFCSLLCRFFSPFCVVFGFLALLGVTLWRTRSA